MRRSVALGGTLILALLVPPARSAASGSRSRRQPGEFQALSAGEVHRRLASEGAELARSAERNGYPDPAQVLELSAQLGLTAEQERRTRALFERMASEAFSLNRSVIEEERRLDDLFASRTVTRRSLARCLKRLAVLQARLRQVHMEAHLAEADILEPAQVARYTSLQGYDDARLAESLSP